LHHYEKFKNKLMSEINLAKSDYIRKKIDNLGANSYKLVVFTALYGYVDNLHDPDLKSSKDTLFVCFTNRKDIHSEIWNIIIVDSEKDSRMAAKYWKFFGYQSFTSIANFSIWVDSSLKIKSPLLPLLNNYSKSTILTFHHPDRNCVYSELLRVLIMGKETITNLIKTFFFLRKNHFKCGNGLIAGTVIVRRTDVIEDLMLLDDLMLEWWWCVNNYSTRDQLTFNFLVDKKKFSGIHKYLDLTGDVYNCRYFEGVRIVKFDSKINPNSRTNLRHKFFHLILLIRGFFKN
jgi:hypothetical protein